MGVSCFRIEYEILPNMNAWTTFIAAFTHEEAVKHLESVVKKPIRITSSGMQCRLDDLSSEVRQNVVDAFLRKQKNELGEQREEPDKTEDSKPKIGRKK